MTPHTHIPLPDSVATQDVLLLQHVRPFGEAEADVLISDEHILGVFDTSLRPLLERELSGFHSVRRFDGRGAIALPALVDLHTHLREPGGEAQETVATGMLAAAAGGYSTVFAMANTDPVTDTVDRVEAVKALADAQRHDCSVNVRPIGAVTRNLADEELSDLAEMAEVGVTVFSDDGHCVDDAGLMREALTFAARSNTVIAQHAQSRALAGAGQIDAGFPAVSLDLAPWPASAEAAVIARDAVLAAETGGRLHVCHVSTELGVEAVAWAKAQGWPVTAEATPHHLFLTDDWAALGDPRFKVNPPLRTKHDVLALRQAVAEGIIDAVATDHAPHTAAQKTCGWAQAKFGMTGLETALPATAQALSASDGSVDWRLIADRMSFAGGRIGGLPEGSLCRFEAGDPADLVLVRQGTGAPVNPEAMRSKGRNTPFIDVDFRFAISAMFLHGRQLDPPTGRGAQTRHRSVEATP